MISTLHNKIITSDFYVSVLEDFIWKSNINSFKSSVKLRDNEYDDVDVDDHHNDIIDENDSFCACFYWYCFIFLYPLALRVTSCLFRLALRGYSVASLPRSFALRARIFGRFAPSKFSKKKVCLNRLEILWNAQKCKKKFFFTPLTHYVLCA